MDQKKCCGEAWISLILRLTIASLFAVAAVAKFQAGLGTTAQYFVKVFEQTWLPAPLVALHAVLIPYFEVLIPIWLLLGIRLKAAWIFAALVSLSLAFGMAVVRGYGVAADNYFYVFLCCFGIYFSGYDRFSIDGFGKK